MYYGIAYTTSEINQRHSSRPLICFNHVIMRMFYNIISSMPNINMADLYGLLMHHSTWLVTI